MYIRNCNALSVSLKSQVHQVFQVGRAQSIPLSSTMVMKSTPISAAETAMRSYFRSRRFRYSAPATAVTIHAPKPFQAEEI